MTMFNITDGNNNVSRDKPVEHIDMVIGLHVSACTSCTRTMRVRRDIAIDITESVQLLVRFNNALENVRIWPEKAGNSRRRSDTARKEMVFEVEWLFWGMQVSVGGLEGT